MDYRNQENGQDTSAIRPSAFSRPSLPPPRNSADDPDPVSIAISSPPTSSTGGGPPATAAVKYRECLRNHAASVGGNVLDGCCEFMPSDADELKCAACGCHRSFHRKDLDGAGGGLYRQRSRISVPLLLPPPHPSSHHHLHHHYMNKHLPASTAGFPASPSGVVAFGGGGNNSGSGATTESSSEERFGGAGGAAMAAAAAVVSKKRFRTKFTGEQKERMMEFAERSGWRIQKQDETVVEQFCREVGVRRQVLKVWMHNNKHSVRKQQQQQQQQQEQQQQQQQQQIQQQQQQ